MNRKFLSFIFPALCFLPSCMTAVSEPSLSAGPGGLWIELYRGPMDRLSAVRSSACPMEPSCSEYSRLCFAQKGFLMGVVMTFDRLIRCGRDEIKVSPKIFIDGRWKTPDPPFESVSEKGLFQLKSSAHKKEEKNEDIF